MISDLEKNIARHDAAIADAGLEIWVGSEPTFTLRESEEPQWLSHALGGDKQHYALQLVKRLGKRHPGSVILRTVGRQYGGEDRPRWSYGVYQRRDQQPLWKGPPDPVLSNTSTDESSKLSVFVNELERAMLSQGWGCRRFSDEKSVAVTRLLTRLDTSDLREIDAADSRLARNPVGDQKTPESGLSDTLVDDGYYLFNIYLTPTSEEQHSIDVEIPFFQGVDDFLQCLSVLGKAGTSAGLSNLLLSGFPPPVDHSVAWTTVTPDPAVIEINQAPQPDSLGFYQANSELFEIADELGLSPYRLHYNGMVSDSGGGGQFTLGGRTAESSPFFVAPNLLPRLVSYFNLHPSLSYLYATNYLGGASQSPRTDEGIREAFLELAIALDCLKEEKAITPELLFDSLSPFLTDASGNAHRSELNIEKLWNTSLPLRGCLGLLEFRAFRMPDTPQRSVTIAMLLRAITAMLSTRDIAPDLHDWKDELHDRFALPFYLRQDLAQVLGDLDQAGFGLDSVFQSELFSYRNRSCWSFGFADGELRLEQAIEYWPLVGDVATQERVGSRLVDSSTQRLQVSLHGPSTPSNELSAWQIHISGYQVPLHDEQDETGKVRLTGLRFREFVPWCGLHPSVKPTNPVTLYLVHPARADAFLVRLYNWRQAVIPYDGLPDDFAEAQSRREERFVVETVRSEEVPVVKPALGRAVTDYSFDLRRL